MDTFGVIEKEWGTSTGINSPDPPSQEMNTFGKLVSYRAGRFFINQHVEYTLILTNLSGQRVKVYHGNGPQSINVSTGTFERGVYLATLITAGVNETGRLFIDY